MYLPRHFSAEDPSSILEVLRRHPLASVVVHDAQGLHADPVVLLADADAQGRLLRLRGHVARANPLWQRAGDGGCEVLALFHGAQAYISPSAHPRKATDHQVVPTWNYLTVQVAGRLRAVDDAQWLRDFLGQLTDTHEAARELPWSVGDAPPDYLRSMLRAVVGIDIEVSRVSAKFKLSQNHPEQARQALAADLLRGRPGDDQRDIASRMLLEGRTSG